MIRIGSVGEPAYDARGEVSPPRPRGATEDAPAGASRGLR